MLDILTEIAKNPESLEAKLLEVDDYITGLATEKASLSETNETLSKQVDELKQTNQRLFMRVAQPINAPDSEAEPERDPWEAAVEAAGFDPDKLLKGSVLNG